MEDPSDDEFSLATEDNRINYNVPALRNARELHLMTEEKWIIEALNKIKNQRDALKVEYLYFQSLKADLLNSHGIKFDDSNKFEQNNSEYISIDSFAHDSTLHREMSTEDTELDECKEKVETQKPIDPNQTPKDQTVLDVVTAACSNIEGFQILEESCNDQELQLNVNSDQNGCRNWDIDDPETESDEEDEEWSKVNLDMEMLVGHNRAEM